MTITSTSEHRTDTPGKDSGSGGKRRPQPPLDRVDTALAGIVGTILQVSDRRARIALGAGAHVAAGAVAAGAGTGLVATFGAASTGAAIGSLYGAAKTTATLYWIGGLVGGGVAAGGVIVAAGGAGAGFYAALRMRRAVFGRARGLPDISEAEDRILVAIAALKSAIDRATAEPREIPAREMALFARLGLEPLISEIEQAIAGDAFAGLTRYRRIRLRAHVYALRLARTRMEDAA